MLLQSKVQDRVEVVQSGAMKGPQVGLPSDPLLPPVTAGTGDFQHSARPGVPALPPGQLQHSLSLLFGQASETETRATQHPVEEVEQGEDQGAGGHVQKLACLGRR